MSTSTRTRARALGGRAHTHQRFSARLRAAAPVDPGAPRGPGANATGLCAIVSRALRSVVVAPAARGGLVLGRRGAPSPLATHPSIHEFSKHVLSSPLAPACRRPRTGGGTPTAASTGRSGTTTSGRISFSGPSCSGCSRHLSVCASVDAIRSLAGCLRVSLGGCERVSPGRMKASRLRAGAPRPLVWLSARVAAANLGRAAAA